LCAASIKRGITFIVLTDHDIVHSRDWLKSKFCKNVIPIAGCEFTTDRGAHIVGLFVEKSLPKGSTREQVIRHVANCGGLLMMPHPWKPHSGYMNHYFDDAYLDYFHFIEIINGGWRDAAYSHKIQEVARRHGLVMIASSDAHKPSQVGLCLTEIVGIELTPKNIKNALAKISQKNVKLLIDKSLLDGKGRKIRPFQKSELYQKLIRLIPYRLRMAVKRAIYRFSRDRFSFTPAYMEVNEDYKW